MSILLDGFGSLTSIPTASKRMNEIIAIIRMYLRDFPELNRLIRGEETSDRMIAWAIVDVLDDWSATPPFLGPVTIDRFPSLSLLRDGVTARVLESAALLQARNQLSFNDGGITVSVSDKAQLYMNFVQIFWNRYEEKKNRFKASQNIEEAMSGGGQISEYYLVNNTYLHW